MKSSRTFSIEDGLFFRLQAYCEEHKQNRNKVIARAIEKVIENIGLIKECAVCGASFSEKLKECPGCAMNERIANDVKEDEKRARRIGKLKEAIERVDLYSVKDVEKMKTELAELEK